MTVADAGAGASPRIVDSDMSATAEFTEFVDYDTTINDAFCVPFAHALDDKHPDRQPQYKSFNPRASQPALGFTDIGPAESPESLNDSFRDSDDSDDSKRTGSSSSHHTSLTAACDMMMTDGPNDRAAIKQDWKPNTTTSPSLTNGDDESSNSFGHQPSNMTSPHIMDDGAMEMSGGLNDDDYFDFESASINPGTVAPVKMELPAVPMFQTNSFRNSRTNNQTHGKGVSKTSFAQPMNGPHISNSRDLSPLSQAMPSHQASPSAVFSHSPSPTNHTELPDPRAYNGLNGGVAYLWPQHVDQLPSGMVPPYPIFPNVQQPWMNSAFFRQSLFNPMQSNCRLAICPTPPKSRVETQIPIKMVLYGAPPTIRRLHLPSHTISKPKLLSKAPVERSHDMLELYTQLVCSSAMQTEECRQKAIARAAVASHPPILTEEEMEQQPSEEDKPQNGGVVRICKGCMHRERKRASRKKIKKVAEEEEWRKDESRRVVVFNTQEVKEWQAPDTASADAAATGQPELVFPPGTLQVDAPMRIACYCRHHAEKMGFHVIFTIKDWQDAVVAQAISPSIMITDDHKTHPVPQPLHTPMPQDGENATTGMGNAAMEANPTGPPRAFQPPRSTANLPNHAQNLQPPAPTPEATGPPAPTTLQPPSAAPNASSLSRPASPSSIMGPANKKRKASGTRVPMEMAMTKLDTSPPIGTQAPSSQMSASTTTSPFTPSANNFQSPDSIWSQPPGFAMGQQPFNAGPTTPNGQDQHMFSNGNRSASMESLPVPNMFSAPTSAHPSRAPSPNTLMQGLHGLPQNPLPHSLTNGSSYLPTNNSQAPAPRPQPTIHKIIPGEGPTTGGIEVTILGGGFTQGLDVYFGEHRATTTTFWGESSLVCLLPPSPRTGLVPVSIRQSHAQSQPFTPNPNQVFKYTGEDETQLTKLMLSIISQKMTGQLLGIKELASRIMDLDQDWSKLGSGTGSSSGFGGKGYSTGTEWQMLKCLELIDLDDNSRMPRLDMRSSTGQSMLHFGCSLGYLRFVSGLLARGANPDSRNNGGFTPMHIAALKDHEAIVHRLLRAGADCTIKSLSGLRPADVARSRKVMDHIRRRERHARSRSRDSLHSRASSAASLQSLWEPQKELDVEVDGEESLEYTSGDFESQEEEDEDDDDGDSWLDIGRRSSTHRIDSIPLANRRTSLAAKDRDELQAEPGSPTQALATAVRDQVAAQLQQFQQAMQMHIPNLGHMPNLPQMPAFPRMLPNYQEYLQQSPFMDRMTSLMPNRTGPRPGSEVKDGDAAPKAVDARWWDLSSLLNSNAAPPPAYSEIYPGGDFDKKQASAALAAGEAEADAKCSRVYDAETKTKTTDTQAEVDAKVKAETETAFEADADADDEAEMASSSVVGDMPKALKIGRKKAITKEQQQDFLRAHAEKFKGIRSDKNLWFIWIPLLTSILAAMLYNRFPDVFATAWSTTVSFVLPVE